MKPTYDISDPSKKNSRLTLQDFPKSGRIAFAPTVSANWENILWYQTTPTLRLGVNGSGSRMFLGKALKIKFLIWIQFGGITSQKLK